MKILRMPSQEEDAATTAAAETDPDNPPWTDDDFDRAAQGLAHPTQAATISLRFAIATLERTADAERESFEPTIERLRASLKQIERIAKGR